MPVYFMQATEGGPIKIGWTRNLEQRHKTLETHYGRSLVILTTKEGGKSEEREIHARFAHLRLGKTEQFKPAPELMEFIGTTPQVVPLVDTISPMKVAVIPPTMIRLTDSEIEAIQAIRERFGLPSMAAAIRYAVDRLHRDAESPKRGRR